MTKFMEDTNQDSWKPGRDSNSVPYEQTFTAFITTLGFLDDYSEWTAKDEGEADSGLLLKY
jgi:hypothetical protein